MIIWVVKHAREEHKAAIEWLNSNTDEKIGFFLCEIKLYRIGTSAPAVKFEVIEKPNDWTKEVKRNESANETQQYRYDYWVAFQDYAFQHEKFAKEFKRRKPSTDHWMNYAIGSSECYISVTQLRNRDEINVCLYIPDNKQLYQELLEQKNDIERIVNTSLSWQELPERKASKIIIEKTAELGERRKWKEQFDWLIDIMLKMKKAFKRYI